jgi:FKBP-type peptidyl-prolyl cis-trans isomerase FkpA
MNKFLFVLSFFALLTGCKQKNTDYLYEKKADNNTQNLIRANRYLLHSDSIAIEAYTVRRGWKMNITNTGLWYEIVKKGTGSKAQKEQKATIAYSIDLLDGTHCYSSDSLGLRTFKIGQGGVESGLEQGILLLSQGDSARFILPPYMAYGITGDGDRIGPRAILVYSVSLRNLSTPK